MVLVSRARAGLVRTFGKVFLAIAVAALVTQGQAPAVSASTLNYSCVPYQTCAWVNFGLRSDGQVMIYSFTATAWNGGTYVTRGYYTLAVKKPNGTYPLWTNIPGMVCMPGGYCMQDFVSMNPGYTTSVSSPIINWVVPKGTQFLVFWHTLAGDTAPNVTGRWACLKVQGNYSVNC